MIDKVNVTLYRTTWQALNGCSPLLSIAFTGLRIARWEGGLFVGYYRAYLVFIVLTAVEHDRLGSFSQDMAGFVLPLTALTLIVLSHGEWRQRRARTSPPRPRSP